MWIVLVVAVVATLVVGWRAAQGVYISAVGLLLAASAWVTAKIAEAHDYHDADGWADCWPSCSPLQRSVAVTLFGGLVMMAAFAVALAFAISRRARRR